MKSYQNNIISLEAQYLYQRGVEMIKEQKDNIGLIYLKQAVFIAPGFVKAYRELGNCLARLGRPEEASIYRLKASRIDPIQGGGTADGVTIKRQDEDQIVHVRVLTCRVC